MTRVVKDAVALSAIDQKCHRRNLQQCISVFYSFYSSCHISIRHPLRITGATTNDFVVTAATLQALAHPIETLKALEALRHLTLDQLQCLLGSKWNEFMNASPERQAQMIGEIFGNIEAGILMEAGAARALGKLKNLRRASDAVDDLEPSGVRLNKEIGDAASDAIAMRYPFALREVPFKTIGGPRIQDVVPLGTGRRVAIESKVGETALSGRIRQEVARDWWLLRQNQVDEIIWEFTPSPITRKGGPQPALLETLQRLGIKVRVNK